MKWGAAQVKRQHSLIGDVNAGYQIFKQGRTAVMAVNENAPAQYVTWTYSQHQDETNYYFGRYGNYDYVAKCFEDKEQGRYSG